MNRKIAVGALAVAVLLAAGCGGKKEKTDAMGPEETVEAFVRAVTGGEFCEAMSLCDTLTMKKYIRDYAQAWDMLVRKDSGAVAIAAAVLAEADFRTEDVVKDGDRRKVTYTLDAGEGKNKKKTATVRKEEGVWIVEEITDSL
ncbi:MAG: DUF4878 domain-containing protein [Bacteroidales bacterium]|nr:DUF4878 domain-containing protein [Bacteroidales bacterium]